MMEALPDEIVQHVLETFQLEEDLSDWYPSRSLYNLALTSKRLHRIAMPILYHSLCLDFVKEHRVTILKTLSRSRELARSVKLIDLGFWGDETDNSTPDDETIPDDDAILCDDTTPDDEETEPSPIGNEIVPCLEAARRLGLHEIYLDRLAAGLTKRTEDAKVAMILVLCDRIETLNLTEISNLENSLTLDVLKAMWSGGQGFRRLENVGIWSNQPDYIFNILEVSTVLHIPNLQSLSLAQFIWESGIDPDDLRTGIKSIDFRASWVDSVGLESILGACPTLKELRINLGHTDSFDFSGLGAALRLRDTTLETLVLEIHHDVDVYPHDVLGSLAPLSMLASLTLPSCALFMDTDFDPEAPTHVNLTELLPSSLQSLGFNERLRREDKWVPFLDDQLLNLMQHAAFTALRKIEIRRRQPYSIYLTGVIWRPRTERAYGRWVSNQILEKR